MVGSHMTDAEQHAKLDQQLRQSEARYRALVQSQIDLICRFLPDSTLTFVNDAYAEFYSSTPEALIGGSFLRHCDPSTLEDVKARIQTILIDPTPSRTEFPWTDPAGKTHWVQWVDQGIVDDSGQVTEIQAVGRDITHLKTIENNLRLQQEWYRSLFEVNPKPVWVYDRETHKFLEVNQAMIEKYGYTRAELLSMDITKIRPENELNRLWIVLKEDTQGFYRGKNWFHRKKDGTVFNVEISSHDLVFNGRPARLVLADDVTEQLKSERALRDSEEKFRTMLEAASEGVLLLDEHGNVIMVNLYIETLFGYDRSEMLGKSPLFLIPDHMRLRFAEYQNTFALRPMFTRIMESEGIVGQCKNGRLVPVEVTLTPITLAGKSLVMCLVIDLTQRKQLEEGRIYAKTLEVKLEKERELIEMKERFISIVSHEFRTPLAVILSSVGILRRYYDILTPDEAAVKLDGISTQVRRMVQLLEDVLTISRGNAEHIQFRPELLSLSEFCTDIAETIRQADSDRHPIIVLGVEQVPSLYGDRRLLEHILLNLLTNAIKYSPEGTPVTLKVTRITNAITFMIRDYGIGIPAEDQIHLFEPFHRAQNVNAVEGTGLGLAIVKQSVEEHGGSITFESVVDKGSSFTVTLPL